MNWWRRLATYRILDFGAVSLTVAVLVWWSVILPPRWSDFDFNHHYVASRMLLEGQNPYTTSLKAMSDALGLKFTEDLPIADYPPSFLWLFSPLGALQPRVAFAVWVALELVCLLVIFWLTRRLLGERLSARGWLFVVALAIMSRPVSYNLYYSQVQLLLAALALVAYAAHRRGKHGWACLVVSIAGILMLYPFVLLPWFVWSGGGGMRVRLYRILAVSGFVLVIVALTGPTLWRDCFQRGMPQHIAQEFGRSFHFSLPALVTNLGYAHHGFHPSAQERLWWWTAGTITALVVIAGAYAVCLSSTRDLEAQFCLLSVAMLAGTFTTQGHYFVYLVFPLTVAAVRIGAKPTVGRVICMVLIVLAFNCVDPLDWTFRERHMFLFLLANDLPLYGLFALGVFFWWELRGRRGPTTGTAIDQV